MAAVERAHPDCPAFQPGKRAYKRFVNRYNECLKYVRGKRTLDVPCGVGWGTSILAVEAAEVHGLDISQEAVDYGMENFERVQLQVGDMTDMPYMGEYFDTVVCLEGYEHIDQPSQAVAVKEITRVLRPGGKLVMTVPLAGYSNGKNKFHLHEPTLEEVTANLAGFNVLETQDIGGVLWFVGER